MNDFEKLCYILYDLSDYGSEVKVNLDTNLINDLGFSSYKFIEMVIRVEKTFKIEFDENDMSIETLNIVKNLLKAIEEKQRGE